MEAAAPMAVLVAARTRRVGVTIDPDRLERELAARGLEAKDLAKLAGVEADTIARARQGGRINRDTLLKIVDALSKVPTHPLAAALVGQGNEEATGKKIADPAMKRVGEEASRASGHTSRSA
ncbi:MAG: helix-turn-helix transcriptional regulator [Chloroflexi bacterium]|nr:MAG: helix-turn-helix transcriptional regulator [Chloroflexota bacterium]